MNIINDIIMPQFNTLQLGTINTITAIEQGVSQHCFHVVVDNSVVLNNASNRIITAPLKDKHYILKVYTNTKELTLLREYKTYQALNNQWPFSAKLIGCTTNILVLEKLAGYTVNNMTDTCLTNKNETSLKLDITCQMMTELHQLSVEQFGFCKRVNFTKVFNQLLQSSTASSLHDHLPTKLLNVINNKIKLLLETQESFISAIQQDKLVVCHGDLNFGNIIVTNKLNINAEKSLHVIDFESLCLMPPEYDIAMCLAVNEIASTSISHTIACYEKYLISDHKLNTALIENYYELSLYINGLWYLQQSLKTEKLSLDEVTAHRRKACSQFNLLTNRLVLNISE